MDLAHLPLDRWAGLTPCANFPPPNKGCPGHHCNWPCPADTTITTSKFVLRGSVLTVNLELLAHRSAAEVVSDAPPVVCHPIVNASLRLDCGYPNQPAACKAAGCCWGVISPNPNDYPWCYNPPPTAPASAASAGTVGGSAPCIQRQCSDRLRVCRGKAAQSGRHALEGELGWCREHARLSAGLGSGAGLRIEW